MLELDTSVERQSSLPSPTLTAPGQSHGLARLLYDHRLPSSALTDRTIPPADTAGSLGARSVV